MAHYCLHDRARRLVVCVDPMCGSNTVREWFLSNVDADARSGDIVRYMIPARQVADLDDHHRLHVVGIRSPGR